MIEWFLGMFFIFGEIFEVLLWRGMLMWLGLLVSTTKRTYNHNIWNIISNIHFKLLNYFYYISTPHLLITKLCFIILSTSWNM
jgi:hypothetical protein